MPLRRRRRILLTPELLADDVLVGEVLDQILLADGALQRIHRQIARRQRELQALVTDEQWRLYMVIEELFNDRWARGLSMVARRFYAAGRRAGSRRK